MVVASRLRSQRLLSLPSKSGCSGAKPPRGAEDALDILFCSEKGWPLPSTASPNAFMSFDSDHIAVLALAAVVIARIK
jgi:hypothetical protein